MRHATIRTSEGTARTGTLVPRCPDVVRLDDRRALDPVLVGSKAAALARARRTGLPALDGFVVTTDARLDEPFGLGGPLHRHWSRQTDGGRTESVVRSSSTVEDGSTSSMAGRFESVLHVSGWAAFEQAVRDVLRSAERAGPDRAPMAVLVQPQATAVLSGVLFGLDPLTGDDRHLLVSLAAGPPEDLVGGRVAGATMTLGRRGRLVAVEGQVPATFGRRQRRALAALAAGARRTFGGPQDIEWLVEPDGTLRLLQSRPITAVAERSRPHQVFGPGPVAETFPEPLAALERDLWLPPLDAGIAEALRLSGAVRRRVLDGPVPDGSPGSAGPTPGDARATEVGRIGRFVIHVEGRVAVDLQALGVQPRAHRRLRALDPRDSLPRLRAAWRIGRLRTAFPRIVDDLVGEVDADLAQLPPLRDLDDRQLLTILSTTTTTLVGLHAHEVLAGLFLDEQTTVATGASVALATLARDRRDGLDDDEIVARHPVVLALVPPRIGTGRRLPPVRAAARAPGADPPLTGVGAEPQDSLAIAREALRLRARWVQELAARGAEEVGERLARRGQLARPGDVRHLPIGDLHALVADPSAAATPRSAPPLRPDLPAAFWLSSRGDVVADRRSATGPARGVSPGRGRGPVVHDPAAADGAVLVVATLDPALADVLPTLAGLVAETGSPLSHLAILAREHRVPTVVGLAGAVTDLEPGGVVTVDGDLGTVEPDPTSPPGGAP